ncbi:MAG: hypothetical protein ACHBN1_07250 [Heteroscytonema crispum UTEX LB 1556]
MKLAVFTGFFTVVAAEAAGTITSEFASDEVKLAVFTGFFTVVAAEAAGTITSEFASADGNVELAMFAGVCAVVDAQAVGITTSEFASAELELAVFAGFCAVVGVGAVDSITSGSAIGADAAGKTPTTSWSGFVAGVTTSVISFELGAVCAFAPSELPNGAAIVTAATNTGDKRILFTFLFTSTHHHKPIMLSCKR